MAATIEELKSVLKDALNKRGVLGQLKAHIRAEVFKSLDDHNESRPPLSNENLLINELIREYLEFNQYRYTSSILRAESGQPEASLDREFLKHELNLVESNDSPPVPLLYGMVAHFMMKNKPQNFCERSPSPSPKLYSDSGSARTNNNIIVHQPQDEKGNVTLASNSSTSVRRRN